ncbi:hypothetical protein FRC02_002549 [Tulasnella sp. 418]|nr:hypothetical protein FRC02_002549 [Tulasnella sp. 418]
MHNRTTNTQARFNPSGALYQQAQGLPSGRLPLVQPPQPRPAILPNPPLPPAFPNPVQRHAHNQDAYGYYPPDPNYYHLPSIHGHRPPSIPQGHAHIHPVTNHAPLPPPETLKPPLPNPPSPLPNPRPRPAPRRKAPPAQVIYDLDADDEEFPDLAEVVADIRVKSSSAKASAVKETEKPVVSRKASKRSSYHTGDGADGPVRSGKKVKVFKVDSESEEEMKKAGGRGGQTYTKDEMEAIFDHVEEILPAGANAWNKVAELHREWCEENGRKVRAAKDLEKKFKRLVNEKPPTGNPNIPPDVKRALELQQEINRKNEVCAPDDSRYEEDLCADTKPTKLVVSHKPEDAKKAIKTEPRGNAGNRARLADLSTNILNTFSPEATAARAESRLSQVHTLSQIQQLNDQVFHLQTQLAEAHARVAKAESRASSIDMAAQLREQFMGMMHTMNPFGMHYGMMGNPNMSGRMMGRHMNQGGMMGGGHSNIENTTYGFGGSEDRKPSGWDVTDPGLVDEWSGGVDSTPLVHRKIAAPNVNDHCKLDTPITPSNQANQAPTFPNTNTPTTTPVPIPSTSVTPPATTLFSPAPAVIPASPRTAEAAATLGQLMGHVDVVTSTSSEDFNTITHPFSPKKPSSINSLLNNHA